MSEPHPISNRAKAGLLTLTILLVAGLGARLAFGGSAADDDDEAPPSPRSKLYGPPGGTPALKMTDRQARALDLKTAEAVETTAGEALVLHGVVLDPFIFLDLDTRRRSAVAAAQAAQSADAAAQAELVRVAALHASDHGASDKALQEAQRAAAEAGAALATAQGEALKAQAAWRQTGLDSVEGLGDFHRVIIRLDLPLGAPVPSPMPRSLVGTSPGVNGSVPLRVLGLAPGGSPLTGGLALLAVAPGAGLRPGLPVDATLPGTKARRVLVPRDALVWSGAKSLVFLEVGDHRFEPRAVAIAFTTDEGIVLSSGLAKGDKVVVQGALAVQGEYTHLSEGIPIGAGGV